MKGKTPAPQMEGKEAGHTHHREGVTGPPKEKGPADSQNHSLASPETLAWDPSAPAAARPVAPAPKPHQAGLTPP